MRNPYNIIISYIAGPHPWKFTPCTLPVDHNPNFPSANPVTITMSRAAGQTWTFRSVNDLPYPQFSPIVVTDTVITITDNRTDDGEFQYSVTINVGTVQVTSPENVPCGSVSGKDDKSLTDAPPIIMNQ
jgi:hypothetical protein